jgi:hypothetical protein
MNFVHRLLRLPSDFGQLQGATRRGHPVWYGFYLAGEQQQLNRLLTILQSGELI